MSLGPTSCHRPPSVNIMLLWESQMWVDMDHYEWQIRGDIIASYDSHVCGGIVGMCRANVRTADVGLLKLETILFPICLRVYSHAGTQHGPK